MAVHKLVWWAGKLLYASCFMHYVHWYIVTILCTCLKKLFMYLALIFCRAMLCNRGLCCHAVSVCLFVCLYVTFVDSAKTNKHIFNFFHLRVAKLFQFSTPNGMAIFRRERPNQGVECRWGRQKSRFWSWLHCVPWTVPAASAIH